MFNKHGRGQDLNPGRNSTGFFRLGIAKNAQQAFWSPSLHRRA